MSNVLVTAHGTSHTDRRNANLFSFTQNGAVHLVTYHDLTIQMCKWLELMGVVNANSFSSHSLCRGGTTHAFENNVPEQTIQLLGDWVSQSFHRFIDLTVETQLKAWFFKFALICF